MGNWESRPASDKASSSQTAAFTRRAAPPKGSRRPPKPPRPPRDGLWTQRRRAFRLLWRLQHLEVRHMMLLEETRVFDLNYVKGIYNVFRRRLKNLSELRRLRFQTARKRVRLSHRPSAEESESAEEEEEQEQATCTAAKRQQPSPAAEKKPPSPTMADTQSPSIAA